MKKNFAHRLALDLKKNKYKYLIILPVVIWLILFCYKPMYGIIIAFKRYRPARGIAGSDWVGFVYFEQFFKDPYFFRLLKNTFMISFLNLLFAFPAAILFALLLNEIKMKWFKKTVQTISYMPHFVSLIVVCGLISSFCNTDGLFNDIIAFFGGERGNLLLKSELFRPIYVISGIWQEMGWSSIIFLAALAGIEQEQYEAAKIDGASRLKQMWYITLPGLLPTISIMLILNLGSVLSVGYEKIMLLSNALTYNVADVISYYVYRRGIAGGEYSFSTAVGLFNSAVNLIFLLASNKISKKMGQSGLF